MAEFLGIAYTNADLQAHRFAQLRTERELELAAQIQESLLPREFPRRDDWRVHGMCANALETGGDYFDVLEVAGGVLLVIADVMGKGMPAALLSVVLRTAVRAHASLAPSPGKLLNRVSLQIAPDLERLGMFVTAQLVFLETAARRVRYASAGHCPVVLLSAEGGSGRVLEEGGLPLGVSRDEIYSEHDGALLPGERLMMVTDGLVEAPDADGHELGTDGLMETAHQLRTAPFGEICARLLAIVRARDAGRMQTDDRTLIIAEHFE
jgi:serine phosphatase RsbU (regulator of sigma subunit)